MFAEQEVHSLARSTLDVAYGANTGRGHAAKEVGDGRYGSLIPARRLLLQSFYLLIDFAHSRLRGLATNLLHDVDTSLRFLWDGILGLARIILVLTSE